MFSPNIEDIQFLFESTGQSISINNVATQAIITNTTLAAHEKKHIHTINPIKMGDLVTIDDESYLITSDTAIKRYGKYKAIMEHCNFTITIKVITRVLMRDEYGNVVYDAGGNPVWIKIEGEPILVPSIIDQQSFTIEGNQLRVANNQILAIVQDNETNRDKLKVNNTFTFVGDYKVLNMDYTNKGLLILTAEKTTS
ncbi:hypothetical protein HLK66_04790 [Niallia circulans]|uniref:hypothetical protein n=1 Tax=Niallia circulans TaxID=1397 RepID=UPI00148FB135|nr:hypothetical protein [Niallia circulans]QJX61030.1 hypothetical protein HLK66_04790 [Niallia circulans]